MTWAFDTIQEFLGHIKMVKDPELFSTAIEYVSRLMSTIHDIDHSLARARAPLSRKVLAGQGRGR